MRLRRWIACLYSLGVGNSSSWIFLFGLPKNLDGDTGILVFVDRLSQMAHLAAVVDSIDGEGIA